MEEKRELRLLKDYIRKNLSRRKAAIWGTGNNAVIAEKLLRELDLEYVYFETEPRETIYNSRPVFSVKEVSKDYYYLISSIYIDEIRFKLSEFGLSEWNDWLYILEADYYEAILRNRDALFAPDISFNDLNEIERQIDLRGDLSIIDIYDKDEYDKFEEVLGFQEVYNKRINIRYRRKILEYYYTDKLIGFSNRNKDFVYIDVGGAGSPFVKWLRETTEISAFSVDIIKGKYAYLPYYLVQDGTHTDFRNDSVDAISMQSSFEMFIGDSDIRVVKEISRILKPGGRAVILPLYMHTNYFSMVSPNFYGCGNADPGSIECIRTDCWSYIPLARFYDVDTLYRRIISVANECGLTHRLFCIPDQNVEKDKMVYLKFILSLEKVE